MESRERCHKMGVQDVRPVGWGKRSNGADRKRDCWEQYEGVEVKVVRRSIGERMLRSIYVCGEFLDGLFSRGELSYIVSISCLFVETQEVYRCNIHVKWADVSS